WHQLPVSGRHQHAEWRQDAERPVEPGRSSRVKPVARAKRGRPSKFGRPSQVAALTLPDEVVKGLKKINPDLAWAIVHLFEKSPRTQPVSNGNGSDAELVKIADRRSLIVVNREAFRTIPGVSIVPLDKTHAFLALDMGRGMADLE